MKKKKKFKMKTNFKTNKKKTPEIFKRNQINQQMKYKTEVKHP